MSAPDDDRARARDRRAAAATTASARITLNRPEALNAWTRRLGEDMLTALDTHADDPEVRVIVFTGAGRAFSSGADLKASGELSTADGKLDVLTPLREVYNPLMLRVRTIDKPVIAAVNGPAVGIGCSLALACGLDRRGAFGLLPAGVRQHRTRAGRRCLASCSGARIGHASAFEIAYLGERIAAEQALDLGYSSTRSSTTSSWMAAVAELAARLAAGPPGSYATIKRTINARAYDDFAAAARAGGRPAAGARRIQGLRRGRDGVRPKAPGALHRRVAARWRPGCARRHRPTSTRCTA